MQFKHPELLYALFLLLIPIIIHLFQLRRFKKVVFTNVAFLKAATMQTRKSSQIKKWLILCTRLLLFAALILAFAQPFTSNFDVFKKEKETVIYLDNSFSMQAKGHQGELLKRAVQNLINNIDEQETISIFTNDQVFKNTSIKTIKNDLLQLKYSSQPLSQKAALLKSKSIFSNKASTLKNLIFISDFQTDEDGSFSSTDTLTRINLVKLEPVTKNNVAIDSAFLAESTASSMILKVILKNSGAAIQNMPISLFNEDKLIAKTSVELDENNNTETTFSLPVNQNLIGKISIDDANLQFDNTLYFNINNHLKINVLAITSRSDTFLKRIYPSDEFNYRTTAAGQLNYNLINQQHIIILNEIDTIPAALSSAINQFSNQGGTVLIIPSERINVASYNQLLVNYQSSFINLNTSKKRVTTINYAHPLFNRGVFEKQVENFQYPKVNSFYTLNSHNASSVLKFEDNKPFLSQNKNLYLFTSSLNETNSSFKNSPLIVPTFYNIAKQSFKIPDLYYTIGQDNTFDVDTQMQGDHVLSLTKGQINLIPKQQYFNNKVVINTSEEPSEAGIYTITNKDNILNQVSFNYGRSESILEYKSLSASKNITISNSITDIFDTLKSDTKVNELWKWFVIFALALLLIEMLLLKFFK